MLGQHMKNPHSQDSAAPMSRSMLLLTLSLNFLKRKCVCLSFGFAVSAFQGFILGGESMSGCGIRHRYLKIKVFLKGFVQFAQSYVMN